MSITRISLTRAFFLNWALNTIIIFNSMFVSCQHKFLTWEPPCTGPHSWEERNLCTWKGCDGTRPCRGWALWSWHPGCRWTGVASPVSSLEPPCWPSRVSSETKKSWTMRSLEWQLLYGTKTSLQKGWVENFVHFVFFLSWGDHFIWWIKTNKICEGTEDWRLDHVEALPDRQTGFLLKCGSVFSPHLGRVYIGRGFCIGLGQHGHHTQQDLLYALDWGPSLTARLIAEGIIAGGVEDTESTPLEVVKVRFLGEEK